MKYLLPLVLLLGCSREPSRVGECYFLTEFLQIGILAEVVINKHTPKEICFSLHDAKREDWVCVEPKEFDRAMTKMECSK